MTCSCSALHSGRLSGFSLCVSSHLQREYFKADDMITVISSSCEWSSTWMGRDTAPVRALGVVLWYLCRWSREMWLQTRWELLEGVITDQVPLLSYRSTERQLHPGKKSKRTSFTIILDNVRPYKVHTTARRGFFILSYFNPVCLEAKVLQHRR